MIKGVNRTIIEVPNPSNRYFERALLFVRPALEAVDEKKLQREADRLLLGAGEPPILQKREKDLARRKTRRRLRQAICFILGLAIGFLAARLWFI